MKIHHIGYAVKDIEKAIVEFRTLGYQSTGDVIIDEARSISIQFMLNGPYLIELVAPRTADAPVQDILKKVGDGPYHICYETPNLVESIEQLRQNKFMLIKVPEVAVAFQQRQVAFLYKKNVGIIELVEVE